MKKFYANFKSVVAAVVMASMTLAASCSYDDSAINERVDKVEKDLAALTERVAALEKRLGEEVEALTDLINGKVVVTEITEDAEGNTIINLSNGEKVTVLAGCDCVPTEPCDCDPLQYRVVDGVLEVSADGENWIAIKVAPECVVAEVTDNGDNTVTIKLANGDEFTVVKAEVIEFDSTRSQLYVRPGETKALPFTINDAVADVNVMNQPLGWKAEVTLAEAEENEDNVDPGMGVLAAGGTEFVLNITGPAQEFVNAGFAEKEGYISVHFNSENGSCKVGKILVNLAELTLDVDLSGNVTLTNSVAASNGVDEMGEPMYDFANFYIGIVDAEDYATYGDNVFVDTFDDWTYEYSANVAATQRTTGFQNVFDLQWYESGVCEKEVYNFTVDQLAQCFWPKYTFEIGKEYIIFVTTESEMAGYVEQPVLKSAIKDTYKRVFVEAILDKENTTWNDATCEFTLGGYDYYVVGWVPTTQLEELVSYGMAADLDSALVFYLQNNGNIMNAGAIVADTEGSFLLSELANYSLTGWAPMLNADTEYYFYVYPFNAASEMELYTHKVDAESIRNYGTFRTKALVLGEFDPAAEFELVSIDEKNISVNATFGEDVVTVAYNWYDAPFLDPEEAAAAILGDQFYTEYVTFDEYTTYLAASKSEYYGLPVPIYLGVLAINAAGEYVYVEEEFAPVPLPEVAITSFEYLGRYWDIADNDDSTKDGEFVYLVKTEDGNEYTINLYYAYCNADGSIIEGTYNYCGNIPDSMYSSYAGFTIISDTEYDGSKLVVAADKITLTVAGVAEYVYVPGAGDDEAGDVITIVKATTDASYGFGDLYVYLYDASGLTFVLNFYNCAGVNDNFLNEGTYQVGTESGQIYPYGYSKVWYNDTDSSHIESGYVTIAVVNGEYQVDLNVGTADGKTFVATYTGAIEGLVVPGAGDEPAEKVFVKAVAEVKDANWYNVTFTDASGNFLLVPFGTAGANYLNVGTWNFDNWFSSGFAISNCYWNGYEDADWAGACNVEVAVVDGAYDLVITTDKSGEYTFNGQIEGLVLPGAGGGDESGDSFTYLGRYYDLDSDASTSGGGYMYKVVAGGVEYSLEMYWAYANADGAIKVGTYNYCSNNPDVMYSGYDGFSIISDSYHYGSTLAVTADGVVTLTLKDVDGNLIGEYTFENVAVFE